MKRLNTVILLVIIMSSSFSSCSSRTSIQLELALCGSYAVPGMFCADLKGDTATTAVVEEDSYGRILFVYSAPNVITQKTESALVVCQKLDKEYVYFYEDICYIPLSDSNNAIALLKEQNDWDCPLEDTKMSKRANHISFDLFIVTDSTLSYSDAIDTICDALKVEQAQIRELQFIDMDGAGNELFWCRTAANDGYMLLIASNRDVAVLEVPDRAASGKMIADFKAENNWRHGG